MSGFVYERLSSGFVYALGNLAQSASSMKGCRSVEGISQGLDMHRKVHRSLVLAHQQVMTALNDLTDAVA